jgi:predicted PurR-regulated permease PerM
MEDAHFRRIVTTILLLALALLAFFLLKPLLLSIILGMILAFILSPMYNLILKGVKNKNLSSFITCVLLLLLIIIPLWFVIPMLIDQSIKLYLSVQQMDFVTPLKAIFPSLFDSTDFSQEVGSILHSFVTKMANSLMNSFSDIILNFPVIFLQLTVVLFTLFFVMRDKEELIGYIKSLLPFSPEVEKKLFKSSKDIASSVLYGQVFIGILQGIVAGIGFFIFGVPNALLFTLFSIVAGIFPIIGPFLVWMPIVVYLFIGGNTFSAVGVSIFGVISSSVDNLIRPVLVSRKTKMNAGLLLIGMIGGLLMFGILGFILGPLILAYLVIVLELYRDKKVPGVLIQETENP